LGWQTKRKLVRQLIARIGKNRAKPSLHRQFKSVVTDERNTDNKPKECQKHELIVKIEQVYRLGQDDHYKLDRKVNHVHCVREAAESCSKRLAELNFSKAIG
jgi:hypothetical protein